MSSVVAKKRGRKRKENTENIQVVLEEVITEPSSSNENNDSNESKDEGGISDIVSGGGAEPVLKKRGRKPKGGKLINKFIMEETQPVFATNVILHLKCSLKDIPEYDEKVKDPMMYNPSVPPEIMTYDTNQGKFSYYNEKMDSEIEKQSKIPDKKELHPAYIENVCKKCTCLIKDTSTFFRTSDKNGSNGACLMTTENTENLGQDYDIETTEAEEDKISLKDINSKLKKLRIQFYKNTLNDKKSACFWCTYDFDNQPCFIPKYEMDGTLCGYGSFCRPECGVAFLMKENIDDSTKFERYQLLNQTYSKVYGYKKNIKPAPNPYYLLEKFYGNFTIQEYRKLLKTEHMLLVIDKPLTRILPELHEDNDEFIMNIYGGVKATQAAQTGGIYKVKRQSEKTQGPTKNSIMRDKFGLKK